MHNKECKYYRDGVLHTSDLVFYDDDDREVEEIMTFYFIDGGCLEEHYFRNKENDYYLFKTKHGNTIKLKEVKNING